MKKRLFFWFSVVFLSFLLISSPALAKGKGKQEALGWDKGEKKGWQSDVPPGQEDKAVQADEPEDKLINVTQGNEDKDKEKDKEVKKGTKKGKKK